MGGFLSGIFTGSNPTLGGTIGTAKNIAGFGTGKGEGYTSTAGDFLQQIMGGNPAVISKLLAPQIGAEANQANQKIQTNAEFGDRSGGTNASNQTTLDTTRGNIDDMISRITGGAVGQLGQMGENLLNTGLNANDEAAKLSQEQLQNQQQSLLGGILNKGVQGGLGLIPGLSSIF